MTKIDYIDVKHCPFEELTNKEQKYIDLYLELGDRYLAYEQSGYSTKGRGWKVNARKKFIQLGPIIEERLDMKVGEGALLAFGVIKSLMKNSDSDAVRLKAAQDYLTRAGHDTIITKRIEITDDRPLTDKELDGEIAELMKGVEAETTATKH